MLEEAIKALSDADAPAARDPVFEVAVLARIERKNFQRSMALAGTITLAAILVLVFLMPKLIAIWHDVHPSVGQIFPRGLPSSLVAAALLTVAGLTLPWLRPQHFRR